MPTRASLALEESVAFAREQLPGPDFTVYHTAQQMSAQIEEDAADRTMNGASGWM